MRRRNNIQSRAVAAKRKANEDLTQTPAAEVFDSSAATTPTSSPTAFVEDDYLFENLQIEILDEKAMVDADEEGGEVGEADEADEEGEADEAGEVGELCESDEADEVGEVSELCLSNEAGEESELCEAGGEEGDYEFNLDDIKPDEYEIQQQWLVEQQEIQNITYEEATTSTVTSAETPIFTVSAQQNTNIKSEDEFIIADYYDNDDVSLFELGSRKQITNETIDKNKWSLQNNASHSKLHFDADKLDMQETDSDEDGYSDIDLDNDYLELLVDDESVPDVYDPQWLENRVMQRKVLPTFKKQKDSVVATRPYASFFYEILNGQHFFSALSYCCIKRAAEIKGSKLTSNYKEFNTQEMSIFFGLCLQMGSMQFTKLADYWECQSYHGCDGFSSKMSYERFKEILEVLNFESFQDDEDNSRIDDNATDTFGDLKPLINFFNNRMETLNFCPQNLVINEPIIYWKGELNWANQMTEKLRNNVIMLHYLSDKSGMVLKLLPQLKNIEPKENASNTKALVLQRLGIAMELMQGKFDKGHVVFVSKYYNSYALCLELLKHGTYSSGVLDKNRFGNSKELILKSLDEFQFDTRYAEHIMMLKSRRKRNYSYFLSSDCLAIYRGEFRTLGQLKFVKEINSHLKSFELRPHILSYQLALERNEIKWEKRIMIFIIHLMLINAYKLYVKIMGLNNRVVHVDTISFESYRQKVIASLLNPTECMKSNFDYRMNSKNPQTQQNIEGAVKQFKIIKATGQCELEKKGHRYTKIRYSKTGISMKKRCRICHIGGLLNFSQFYCDSCPGMPGLCKEPCFKIWHTKMIPKWPPI